MEAHWQMCSRRWAARGLVDKAHHCTLRACCRTSHALLCVQSHYCRHGVTSTILLCTPAARAWHTCALYSLCIYNA
jgi:hypothetical protein